MASISNPFKTTPSKSKAPAPPTTYRPEKWEKVDVKYNASVGKLALEFEAFKPNAQHSWAGSKRKTVSKGAWDLVEPVNAPPIPNGLPEVFNRVMQSCWKVTEPTNAERGHLLAGTRGTDLATQNAIRSQTYHAQVRPIERVIETKMPNQDAIATDWKVFEEIKRKNAVCFRGDTRTPVEVFNCGGFTTPESRTDEWYLTHAVFDAFRDYLIRRYKRKITFMEFDAAIRSGAPSSRDKELLVLYTVWRRIVASESMHMGRMVENECLKGYISCSTSIDSSRSFGTAKGNKDGWLYLVIVQGGFVVPFKAKAKFKNNWESGEAEIAQWGAVPNARIVGFVWLNNSNGGRPDGPIFISRTFRNNEPKAFEIMFNTISGWTPA